METFPFDGKDVAVAPNYLSNHEAIKRISKSMISHQVQKVIAVTPPAMRASEIFAARDALHGTTRSLRGRRLHLI